MYSQATAIHFNVTYVYNIYARYITDYGNEIQIDHVNTANYKHYYSLS